MYHFHCDGTRRIVRANGHFSTSDVWTDCEIRRKDEVTFIGINRANPTSPSSVNMKVTDISSLKKCVDIRILDLSYNKNLNDITSLQHYASLQLVLYEHDRHLTSSTLRCAPVSRLEMHEGEGRHALRRRTNLFALDLGERVRENVTPLRFIDNFRSIKLRGSNVVTVSCLSHISPLEIGIWNTRDSPLGNSTVRSEVFGVLDDVKVRDRGSVHQRQTDRIASCFSCPNCPLEENRSFARFQRADRMSKRESPMTWNDQIGRNGRSSSPFSMSSMFRYFLYRAIQVIGVGVLFVGRIASVENDDDGTVDDPHDAPSASGDGVTVAAVALTAGYTGAVLTDSNLSDQTDCTPLSSL